MAALPGIIIKIGAETRDAIQGINKVDKALQSSARRTAKMNTAVKNLGKGLGLAAAAGGAAAIQFGVEGVKAAIQDEKATTKLAKTMKNLGKAQDVDRAEDFIETLMQQTGIADDELRPAFEKLVQATGDTDTAMALLKTSVDTAVGSGKPLEAVTTAIAKGMNGQVGALGKLVPGLDTAAAKADPLNSIMEQLNKRFGGQAATQMGTFAGQSQSIATAFGELQESFGKGLLGSLDGTSGALGDMDDTLYSLGPSMEELGATLGGIAISVATIAEKIGPVVQGFNDLNSMSAGWLTDGTLTTALKNIARIQFYMAAMNGDTEGMAMYANDAGIPGVSGSINPAANSAALPAGRAQAFFNANRGVPAMGTGGLYRDGRYNNRANDATYRGRVRGAVREARARQLPWG